jgi:methylated-DNA-[protein]-cysteine S-methyltransferase
VRVTHVSYHVPDWGVGEVVLAESGVLLAHEAPVPGGSPRGEHPLARRFGEWFAGSRDDFLDVELDTDGLTGLQLKLLDTLRRVPYGEVVSYGELAAQAGFARAARAAGTFCAHNRFSLVVPCHRVVSVSGIGGYGGLGVEYKRRLLEVEGVTL